MILSQADIEWMEDTVQQVIKEWNTKITIFCKLPVEQQVSYNDIMHEFTGNILATAITIDAERKDLVNNQTNDLQPQDIEYGKRNEGVVLFAIPNDIDDIIYKPSIFDVVKIDNSEDIYYIRSIRDRIGETLITLRRFTGSNYQILENEKGTYSISGYGWEGE